MSHNHKNHGSSRLPPFIGVEGLLSRLEKVRRTKPGHWMASSPARKDKNPSLSIRELDDGRVLLHDFGGSDYFEILSALGIHPIELVPDHLRHNQAYAAPYRAPLPCCDAILAVAFQASVVQIAAEDLLNRGTKLSERDLDQLFWAVNIIENAFLSVKVQK